MLSSAPPVAVGTFAHTRRWAADVDKTLLVLKGQVPVRDGRVCYADGSVEGAQALEAVSFGARAKAVSADGLPDEAVLSALGGAVSWTAPRSLLQPMWKRRPGFLFRIGLDAEAAWNTRPTWPGCQRGSSG